MSFNVLMWVDRTEGPRDFAAGVVAHEEHCPPLCPPDPAARLSRKSAPNPIVAENNKPGDADWRSGSHADAVPLSLNGGR